VSRGGKVTGQAKGKVLKGRLVRKGSEKDKRRVKSIGGGYPFLSLGSREKNASRKVKDEEGKKV